ncbi:MAG: M50 family metallopeptidase, partial [Flavobacteriales bacterium]|nr:M50 family metallopeptidase [Flavobacteriales bacterium]
MASALRLFSFRDIQVRVHWTFLLLIGWIVFSVLSGGQGFREVLVGIVLVLVVFTCVVLHEFGHALTARHFGVNTRNITLYPIGGVASLERMPEEPKQEFLITLAGPLVNLAIVLLAGTVHL